MISVRNTTFSADRTIPKHGARVAVTILGGNRVVRRVWEANDALVYLCTDEMYERLSRGESAAQPIAFPIEDVCALA